MNVHLFVWVTFAVRGTPSERLARSAERPRVYGIRNILEPANDPNTQGKETTNTDLATKIIDPKESAQLTADLNTMFEEENDFGFVPGFEELPFEGGVPSSLNELVDWLDIAGGETPDAISAPHDIQHFRTFSTDDKWPI